ncbi:replication restart helicase PriA [Neorickettsia sennetsu]|uniref:Replication restart protein PriA n=1 Tax=Ehrlichia sennetsu (strain ATCC VR-367 / Miyayama) TaxID=222891 RepID=Q2GEJ5_EHRS3|nr:primosomal protein N' [Neorickettsia sennetsu]ABD45868.1 primosomal protein N' [Neorickettsia sennetsu str. Miyayama]
MYLNVVLPLPLDSGFLYSSGHFDVYVGSLVKVDFRGRKITGLVTSVVPESEHEYIIKEILAVEQVRPFSSEYVQFLSWIAYYNFTKLGLVLRSALVKDIPDSAAYILTNNNIERSCLTPAVCRVLALFRGSQYITSDTLDAEKIQRKTVQKLIDIGAIERIHASVSEIKALPEELKKLKFELSDEQSTAREKICMEGFTVYLLDGVTGSGKTLVYLSAALEILQRDAAAQVIMLFSEIALASYIFERIKKSFLGMVEIVEWHSDLSPARRRKNWHKVVTNKARLIIGARSAILLPIPNLQMIVVDEEHDQSFKQDQGDFTYNARDLAIMRGKLFNIPVILSSATPSLESYYNVQKKGFVHLTLERRFGGAQLPDVRVVDMRKAQKVSQHISHELYEELNCTFDSGMQSLLFLNKRGYASIIICSSCGHRMKCPDCIAWLVEHKQNNTLLCHLCGFKRPMITKCEECSSDKIISFGPGVEKIAEEIGELFPSKEVLIMSSDTKITENIQKIEKGDVDIVIGTQIIAKGYDFPRLTLLAIIDSDVSMHTGDLRNSEKSFQILQQAIGRVGRRKVYPGRVVLQSYSTDSVVVEALKNNDRETFYKEELKMRLAEEMPPFSRLISIIISGLIEREVIAYARKIAKTIIPIREINVFGPCPAAIGMRKKRFRYRILIVVPKNFFSRNMLTDLLTQFTAEKKVEVQVDTDPLCFL